MYATEARLDPHVVLARMFDDRTRTTTNGLDGLSSCLMIFPHVICSDPLMRLGVKGHSYQQRLSTLHVPSKSSLLPGHHLAVIDSVLTPNNVAMDSRLAHA